MNPAQLLEHFDRISEAPDAIPRLRRFILDLAVRGKLVEQDPNDEPASELLKRIKAEKSLLIKEGKLRKQQSLRAVDKDEIQTVSPPNWEWERLGSLSVMITKGSTPTSYGHPFTETGINFIKVEAIKSGRLLPANVTSFVSEATHNFLARSRLELGDILFSIAGSIGTCAVVTQDILPANTNQALAIIRGTMLVFDPKFLLICIQSSVAQVVLDKSRGGAMNNVSLDDIQNFVVPLPPLAEQHRIVAKVDELMALCDQLEAAKTEREQSRNRLVAASLQRLNQPAEDETAFREHAHFAFNHLPRITTRPAHTKQLRQTILNLAVRGKLVPQDPNDEPAAELLKRIQTEKGRLVKTGDIRKEKHLPPITKDSLRFALPPRWEWVRLGTLSKLVTSGSRDWASYYAEEGAIFVRMGNLSRGSYELRLGNIQRVKPPRDSEGARTRLEAGDILVSITGEVGLLGLIPPDFGEAYINQHTCVVRLMPDLQNRFVPELFRSPFAQDQFNAPQRGIKNSFRLTDVTEFLVPLPPLAEQHRIVAKVDELMTLCDQLEAQLTTTETDSRRLLEAVLHEALAPALENAAA